MAGPTFTTVVPTGSPAYVNPYAPGCPSAVRYMAVHRINGGGWGIVDRRSGRLLAEERADQHRYASWTSVQQVVQSKNSGGTGEADVV
jgi:hypothetical protein